MTALGESDSDFEIAHVLCTDIVGYSKLMIDQQSDYLHKLNEVVRATEVFQRAEQSGKLIRIPTGDGMVLVFFTHPQDPAECAVQISKGLKAHPEIALRMGVHSGPVNRISDVNQRSNVAGAGINIGQRVMDCGDAGHILLSKRVAEDLGHYSKWRPHLHELGEFEVKHGVKIELVNLFTDQVGNAARPEKLKEGKPRFQSAASPLTRPMLAAAILIALAMGAGWFFLRGRGEPQLAAIFPGKSVAIAPFKPLVASNRDEVLEAGMADTLINKLSTSREIIVPSLSSVRKYDDQKLDPVTMGRELHVNAVLEGNVQKAGDRIRVTARLIKVADGSSLWAQTFDEKFTDVFAVQDTIAQKVATALALKLSEEEQQRLTRRHTDDTEAYQLYLKGRFNWNKYTEDGWRKSIEFFKQAAEKDPNYALAYSGMADSYSLLGEVSFLTPKEAFENARTYAEKALKLDEALSEAHLSLGIVKLFYDWDVPAAARELLRAKELDRHNVQVYHFNGHRLEFEARFEDAITEFKRGVDIDPTNLIINTELGNAYYLARQFDAAITQCRKTLELDPTFEIAVVWLAQAYEQKGMYQQALAELNKLPASAETSPFSMAEIGCSEAGLGHRAEAEKIIKKLEDRMAREYVDPSLVAYVYIVLGDKDRAFAWLERGFHERAGNMPWMKIEPKFDPLRGDPRLTDLLRRIGID
jgi:TolB-like protein/thioredoxin-like negative regulator of GroEL